MENLHYRHMARITGVRMALKLKLDECRWEVGKLNHAVAKAEADILERDTILAARRKDIGDLRLLVDERESQLRKAQRKSDRRGRVLWITSVVAVLSTALHFSR